jgi:serine/threonine protein kinase
LKNSKTTDGKEIRSDSIPGGTRFGNYVLTRKIGHGGMAEVFIGHRIDDWPSVSPRVIKCILPNLAHDPQFLAMFINEAQLAAQMDHRNIVKVFEFGEFGGRLYMAMEYVEGLDCWRFTRRLHPWGEDHTALAIWIVCEVLNALEYAHDMTDVNGNPLNVIHRDLSPSNIYLSLKGEVKLGDFGIARIDSSRYRQITMIPKGKFGYVAPEQVEGLPIDKRADIFAVGIVLAELLIGKKMFSGPSQLSIMLEIKDARLDTLEQNVDRVEPPLLDILLGALARDPANRYGSAAEFRNVLLGYLEIERRTPAPGVLATQLKKAVEHSERARSISSSPPTPTTSNEPLESVITAPSSFLPAAAMRNEETTPLELGSYADLSKGTPITSDSTLFEKDLQYTARLDDGRIVGPTSYAHIIELICSDHIGPDTPISMDGRNFLPASSRPELTRHLPAYTPTWDEADAKTPDKRGILQIEAPAEVTLSLAIQNETGMLLCRQNEHRKEIYFQNGRPVYISSNTPGELLGEYLVSIGAIERAELEMALALLPKFNGHMGDTLIALGMLSAVELFNFIGDQVRSRFKSLMAWRYGQYEFYRGTACRSDVLPVPLEPFSMVVDCLLEQTERIPVDATLSAMSESTVSPSLRMREMLDCLDLPSELESMLRGLSNPRAIKNIDFVKRNPRAKKDIVQAIYIAIETGLWMLEGISPPWRTTDSDLSD